MTEGSYPRITVVTVNYNLGEFLEEAMLSVLDQGYPNLEYIVVDGGSTDGSQDIIRKYEDKLSWWLSEPDNGQYDAVQKGFDKSTGEIMCWINSDDKLMDKSLFAVAEIFSRFKEVEWLQGFPVEFNRRGTMTRRIALPWARWSKYRYLTYDFQFIQQESCFWRRSLWEKAGANVSSELKLAGDMELWARFFRHAKLYTTMAVLGGFRHRGGSQRSRTQMGKYIAECASVVKRERKRLSFLNRFGLSCLRLIGFPMGICFFFDIPFFRNFYRWIFGIPPIIRWDFDADKWVYSDVLTRHPSMYWGGRQVTRKGFQDEK